MSLASFPRSLHWCLKALLLTSWQPFLSTPRVPSCKCRLGCGGCSWAWGQLVGGRAGANLTADVRLLGIDLLWSGPSWGSGFSSSDAESNGVGVYLQLPGFGPWAWAHERYPCCGNSGNCPLLLWAGRSRSMANQLYVLSRKLLERCYGEGSLLLLLPSWHPGSCFPIPMGRWSLALQGGAWLLLLSWGCNYEVLLPLPHAACALQAQWWHLPSGIYWWLPSPGSTQPLTLCLPPPCPPHEHWGILWWPLPWRALGLDVRCRDKCNKGPTSKRCVFPGHWLDSFPKASRRRCVFGEDLNKEREEVWRLHLGVHQLLSICVQSLYAAVSLSLLSCWWFWFLLCLFIFTPLLNLLLLDSLLLLAPDKLLPLISLKLLPLTNL